MSTPHLDITDAEFWQRPLEERMAHFALLREEGPFTRGEYENTGCRGEDDIWHRRPSLEEVTRLPIFVGVNASTFAPQIKADTAMVLHNGILNLFRCNYIDSNSLGLSLLYRNLQITKARFDV